MEALFEDDTAAGQAVRKAWSPARDTAARLVFEEIQSIRIAEAARPEA